MEDEDTVKVTDNIMYILQKLSHNHLSGKYPCVLNHMISFQVSDLSMHFIQICNIGLVCVIVHLVSGQVDEVGRVALP